MSDCLIIKREKNGYFLLFMEKKKTIIDKKVKKMKMAPRRLRSLMGILISQIPNCEMDENLISNSTLSLVVSVNAIYSPMASEPISCMLESMRMSQTLAENGTTSVILTCLHIPSSSLIHIYRKYIIF